ncbi:MAG: serine hydrolase [Bacteroidota bacterium]
MQSTKTFLLYLCLFILPTSILSAQALQTEAAGMSAERLQRYDDYLQKQIDEGNLAGAVSMVMRKGKLAHAQSFGQSNATEDTPMGMDQIFFIQSMTKPIISAAIMMLYEEGHFMLNDPVQRYLPQFKDIKVALDPENGKDGETEELKSPIRIAHLLSHTSGLSHGLGRSKLDQDYFRTLYFMPHKSIEDRINAMTKLPLYGQPGEQWYYSASPDVLSLLVEHFSGMTTAEFLQKRIFEPLDMKDTGYNIPKEDQGRMAMLHTKNKEGDLILSPRQTPMEGNLVFAGANGLFSTAGDYMKFCQMIMNGGQANGTQFLSPKTIELMAQNHVGDLYQAPGEGFGLGFAVVEDIADLGMASSVGQLSWSGAYCTFFFIDPAEEMVAILMTQTAPYNGFWGRKMRQFIYQAIVD